MDKEAKPDGVDSLREKAEEELFLRQSEGDHGLRKNEDEDPDLHIEDSHEELSLQHVQQGSGLDSDNIKHGDSTNSGADRAADASMRSGPEAGSVQAELDAAAKVANVRDEGSADSIAAYEGSSVDREPEKTRPDIEQQPRSTIERYVQADVDGSEKEPAAAVAAQESQDVTTDDGIPDTSTPNITGSALFNTAPVAGDDVQLIVHEGDSRLGGQLTAVDNDAGSTIEFSLAEGYSAPAGFNLNENGDWSFDATETAYDRMGAGDSAVFTIPVTVTDSYGETDTLQIQITLKGTNDAPVADADIAGVVDEGAVVINGQLTATDVDSVDVTFTVAQDVGVPAGFSLGEGGEYSFNPANQAYDHLGVGDSEVITVPVTVSDVLGAFDSTQIKITVNGTNDGPVAGASVIAIIDEGAAVISGRLNATDADDGSALSFAIEDGITAPPGFNLNADGSYSFDPGDAAYDHLGVGDVELVDIPVTVTDEQGASDTTQIRITVNGTNDAPVAGAIVTASAIEDGTVLHGQVSASDVDYSSTLSFAIEEGAEVPAGFTFSADGSYSFDPGNSAYNDLRPGETEELMIPVTVTDELGATTFTQVRISVNGTNESPVAVDDSGYQLQNATLTAELNFDNGVPSAMLGTVNTTADGQIDDAANFTAAKVELSGIDLNGDAGAQTTVSMWVKADPSGSWEMLAASDRYDMVMLNGDIGFNTARGDLFGTDASELADGEWHHVVGTFTNGDVTQNTLFIDGEEQTLSQLRGTPSNASANIDSSDGNMYFGSWGANNNYRFTGSMDEVKVFDGPLNAEEVNTLYNIESDHVKWDGAALNANEDTALTIDPSELLANDTDSDGGTLSIISVQDAEHGSVEIDADGKLVFTPDENYSGEAAFTYTISDGDGGEGTATATLHISSENDLPTIDVVNTITVDEDGSQNITYRVDDVDGDDVTLTAHANNGSVVVNGNGTVTFTPDENYNGDDTITLSATDSQGGVTTAEIAVSVTPVNDAPEAVDDTGFEPQSATLAAELTFDNGTPTAMLGTVNTAADGQVDDAANFTAAKVELSGIDLNGDAGAQTTVSMWVKADPSGSWEMLAASDRYDMVMLNGDIGFNTARGDLFGTDASELADDEWHHVVGTFTNGDVTQNTLFIDGEEQTLSQLRGTPSNASANIDSSDGNMYFGSWGANNNYRFTGSMDEVKVFDGPLNAEEVNTLYNIESDHVKWDGAALNANEDTALTIDPSELLANDTDPDGGTLSIISVQDAEHGSVEIDADGKLVFTPDENYSGEAAFTYTISDGDGGEGTATATLHISSENDLPTIDVVNTITVDEDGSQNITYRVDDVDGDDVTLTAHANNGSVVVNGNGTVTFTPDENYNGDDTITLSATDSQGGVTTAEIAVSVTPVNDAPEAVDDTGFEPQSATLAAELTFDNGTPTAMLGTVNTAADGQVDDAANFTAAKVELSGIDLNSDAGAQTTVSMWVKADPSGSWEMLAASDRYDMVMLNGDIGFNTARGDLFGTDANELADGEWHHVVGTFTNGDVSQNTLFIDGEEQTLSQLRGTPSNASANIDSSDGNLYFGSWGANNNYRFTGSMDEVKVFDGPLNAEEVNTLYNIESDHVNWDGAALSTDEDTAITIDVLANDIDVDGDTLTIIDAGTATDADGNVVGSTEIVEADGKQQIRFTPNDSLDAMGEGENKMISLNYSVSDEEGKTSNAEVTVNVTGLDNDITVTDIVGTSRSESLTGTDEQESIWGLEGNDTIHAGDGDDTVIGGAGYDNLYGGAGDDSFIVGADNAGLANDYHGGDGTDRIVAQDGEDVVINSHLRGSDSIEEIVGEGDTVLSGDNSSQTLDLRGTKLTDIDRVEGGGGNDTIYNNDDGGEIHGGAGYDNLYGGAGDDSFVVDADNAGVANDYHGGDGTDRIVAQDGEDVVINSHLRGSDSIEEIVGEGDTVLSGDNSSQTLDLRGTKLTGIDRVEGGGGNDTIYNNDDGGEIHGGAGYDNLYGGAGDDSFVVDADNAGVANDYHGGDGTDRIVAQDGEDVVINSHLRGSDSIEEIVGEGDTVLSGDNSSQTLDLRGTKLTGIDRVEGGGGNDTIYNNDDGGEIHGGAGYDNLYGGAGDDSFVVDADNAGVANDYHGGDGTDRIVAQDGEDVVINSHLRGSDSIEEIVGEGDTVLSGDNSSQTLDLRGTKLTDIDRVDGGGGNDTIYSNDDGGDIHGGAGSDRLYGGDGNDTLSGDTGKDSLYGGDGDDTLSGGAGDDRAWGGEGNDTYVVNPFDGSDYFQGGDGGGWTDAIDISATVASDPGNPWTVEVDGAQVQYELASGALELNPDTSGVITFGDGTELAFDGLEKIEW